MAPRPKKTSLGGGPKSEKKVVQEESWRAVADLKTRCQQTKKQEGPKRPQKEAPKGVEVKKAENAKIDYSSIDFGVFCPPEGPHMCSK